MYATLRDATLRYATLRDATLCYAMLRYEAEHEPARLAVFGPPDAVLAELRVEQATHSVA